MQRFSKVFGLLAFTVGLATSCTKQPLSPTDPYESANRKTCGFNMVADNLFFKPIAKAYVAITPNFLQAGIHNMFKNIFTTTTVANDLFQGRIDFAAADTTRIILNSTLGILGFFDVAAKHFKLPYHYEDFGMTLAYWGATNSKYLMVPIFGPRTFRDAFGIPFDIATNPLAYITPFWMAVAAGAAAMVDTRAQYLAADAMVAQSFDPYTFLRDAYLQNRAQMIAANNSMKSYREFQAQQLQGFAPALSMSNADDTGLATREPDASTPGQSSATTGSYHPVVAAPAQ